MEPWWILAVDDEDDVHAVTALALKRRTWRGRPFELVDTRSQAEAKQILASNRRFDVCLIDAVMESDQAGLELCQHIRNTQPRSTRVVLRTGQPGKIPEVRAFTDFDIDYYLDKSDLTEYRLYQTVCSCLRSSEDLSMLIIVNELLANYIKAAQDDEGPERFVGTFAPALHFLEQKYGVGAAAIAELSPGQVTPCSGPAFADMVDTKGRLEEVWSAVRLKGSSEVPDFTPQHRGSFLALPFRFVPTIGNRKRAGRFFDALATFFGGSPGRSPSGCVLFYSAREFTTRMVDDLSYDVRLFAQSWKVAYELLATQRAVGMAALASVDG